MCLFPDPYPTIQLLRRVGTGLPAELGTPFWGAASIPPGYEEASKREGIGAAADMDAETRADIATLKDWSRLPCALNQTTKCEACVNGCDSNQNASTYASGSVSTGGGGDVSSDAGFPPLQASIGGGAEYTHYNVPNSTTEVILHRTKGKQFTFTYRPKPSVRWSSELPSSIPDVRANLNAGVLPNGKIFLVSNPCPSSPDGRDPLAVSTSANGWDFDRSVGVMSCKQLGSTEKCGPRIPGHSKNSGPSYPQGVVVTGTKSVDGLYVVATNNKEDVWVAKVPFSSL
jgi:hypothetical protein